MNLNSKHTSIITSIVLLLLFFSTFAVCSDDVQKSISELKNPKPDVRVSAAEYLAEIGDRRALKPLFDLLKDHDPKVRSSTALALVKFSDPRIIPPLLAAFKDTDSNVRANVLQAFDKVVYPCRRDIFRLALKDKSEKVRTLALSLLGSRWDKGVFLKEIIATFNDKSPLVRKMALWALTDVREPEIVEPILVLVNDPDPEVRKAAIRAISFSNDPRALKARDDSDKGDAIRGSGQAGAPKSFESLQKLLNDPDSNVRAHAAGELWKINPKAAEPLILPIIDRCIANLGYPVAGARKVAAWQLGYIAHPRAVQPLLRALKDSDKEVKEYAVVALGEIGDRQAVPALIKMFNSKDYDQNYHLVWKVGAALGKFKDQRAVPVLIKAMKDAKLRRTAAEVLPKIGVPAVEPLIKLLRNKDARGYAAGSLGIIKDPRAVMPLISVLYDNEEWTNSMVKFALTNIGASSVNPLINLLKGKDNALTRKAVEILGKINDQRVVDPLIEMTKHSDVYVKFAAVDALGDTKSPRAIPTLISLLSYNGWGHRAGVSLKKIDPPPVRKLLSLLNHDDHRVRASAVTPTGGKEDRLFVDLYVMGMKNEDDTVRRMAIDGVSKVFPNINTDIILTALTDKDDYVREKATQITLNPLFEDPRVVTPLCKLIKDERFQTRETAAVVLKVLSDPQSVPCLLSALNDTEKSVRENVLKTLGNIGDISSLEPIIASLKADKNRETRLVAIDVLGNFKDSRAVPVLLDMAKQVDLRSNALVSLKKITRKEYSN